MAECTTNSIQLHSTINSEKPSLHRYISALDKWMESHSRLEPCVWYKLEYLKSFPEQPLISPLCHPKCMTQHMLGSHADALCPFAPVPPISFCGT